MAFSFKYTRYSALVQTILGFLCIVFGIADRATMYDRNAFHSEGVISIWMGIWILVTGIVGILASNRGITNQPKVAAINTYLGFSIVSTVFAGVMIICYSIGCVIITNGRPCSQQYRYNNYNYNSPYYTTRPHISLKLNCQTSVALALLIIVFAVVEFGVGIWASVCCCYGGCNNCCNQAPPTQSGQVVYIQGQQGAVATYVLTQGPNGVPVAVPAMTQGPAFAAPPTQMTQGPAFAIPANQMTQGAVLAPPATQMTQGAVTQTGSVQAQNQQVMA